MCSSDLWRWRSQERGVLAEPPAGRLTVAARALRRTFGPAAAATLGGAIAEAPSEYARGLVAAGRGFVVSTPVDKEAPAILTRLDAATGEESWSFDLTAGLAPRDVLFDGRNLVAVFNQNGPVAGHFILVLAHLRRDDLEYSTAIFTDNQLNPAIQVGDDRLAFGINDDCVLLKPRAAAARRDAAILRSHRPALPASGTSFIATFSAAWYPSFTLYMRSEAESAT